MRKALLFLFCIGLFPIAASAQKLRYHSNNYLGWAMGESMPSYQILTVHGLQANRNFLGIGGGIDNYYIRSVPLFLSATRQFLPCKCLFVNGNIGTQFIWSDQHTITWNSIAAKYLPGFFGEAGLGYALPINNTRGSFLFGAYYSYKQYKEKLTVVGNCTNPPCNPNTEYINAKLNRWVLKLGFAW